MVRDAALRAAPHHEGRCKPGPDTERNVGWTSKHSKKKVEALTAPRNAVLVGASDRPGSWAGRVWRNLHKYEFPGPVYPINPRRTELWDKPCYPDFKSLPEPPDHSSCWCRPRACRKPARGRGGGARSATVFSSGFGEAYDTEAAGLGRELAAVIAETGLAVSGPNCMGNVCAKTRLVTFPEDRMLTVQEGPVAMVGQSGGMMLFANGALNERGIVAEYLITSGNEAGLSVGDYIAFFADQPELKVIVIYVEAVSDLDKFKAACRMARAAGKHIVALKLGQSEGGRRGGAGAHRLARGLDRGVRCGGGRGGRHSRRHARRRRGDDRAAGVYRRAGGRNSGPSRCRARSAACCSTPPRRTACTSGRCRQRPQTRSTRCSASARWWETHRRRLWRAYLGRQLRQFDRHHAGRSERRHRAGAGADLARPRLRRAEKYVRLLEDYAATRAKKPIAFCAPTSHGHTDFSRALRAGRRMCRSCRRPTRRCARSPAAARRDELERLARYRRGRSRRARPIRRR